MPETPTFATAAVAAPHALAAETGRAILAEGGNAVEAMIAMAATIAVVYPHMNGIGGDAFWLVREPRGRVHAIDACGPAGALATIARYRAMEVDAIPTRGPDSAITVAGAVGGWQIAHDLSRALQGRLPVDVLLDQAIRLALEGCPVSASEARYVPDDLLLAAPGFSETFLTEGKPYAAGSLRRLGPLADTLAHLATAGLDDFYRGDVGREIAADLERLGAPVTRADLARYRARTVAPLDIRLDGVTVYNLPPPTQGLASLLILGIAERLGAVRLESVAHHHGLIEAVKRAFGVRDRVVTDPAHRDHEPAEFLDAKTFEREASQVRMDRAAPFPMPPADGGTVWMGAIDRSGLAVSYIQSVYWEYGSGCVLPRTGIHWQNRGLSFSLDPRARNPLEPGRKPFHTLNPALAVFDDGRVLAYGCMGGDGQPQTQAQIFTRYRMGMGLADAVDAPRWLLGRTWGDTTTTLKVEARFDDGVVAALSRMGHVVEPLAEAYSDRLGHAGMLVRRPRDGRIEATHDPRSDGAALGD